MLLSSSLLTQYFYSDGWKSFRVCLYQLGEWIDFFYCSLQSSHNPVRLDGECLLPVVQRFSIWLSSRLWLSHSNRATQGCLGLLSWKKDLSPSLESFSDSDRFFIIGVVLHLTSSIYPSILNSFLVPAVENSYTVCCCHHHIPTRGCVFRMLPLWYGCWSKS